MNVTRWNWQNSGAALVAIALLSFVAGCPKDDGTATDPSAANEGDSPTSNSVGKYKLTERESNAKSDIRFEEMTAKTGVNFVYRNGEDAGEVAILESLGGGVGLFDFDNDGDMDLCLPGGGHYGEKTNGERPVLGWPHAIFRNDGDWKFTEVTKSAAANATPYYSHGAAAADFDNDGFLDVLITGFGGLLLLHNHGDGTFEEHAKLAGMTDALWSSTAAWGDFNKDGALDVYIAHYANWSFKNHPFCPGPKQGTRESCPPREFQGLPDTVYFNNGDGSFRDVSQEVGLKPDGKGLGVLTADLDLDGDVDVYVGNDTVPNFLYQNDGTGKFEETGLISGTALSQSGTPDGSMGVDVGDITGDGRPDLWVVNFERESNALYRNDGNGLFQHISQMMGVTAVGALYVGWGTSINDFDKDGDEDPFVSNGHVIRYPENAPIFQKPLMFDNRNGKRLENVASVVGPYFAEGHQGRGSAAGDIDRDGDVDLVISRMNQPVAFLSNTTVTTRRWLSLRLVGVTSPRIPIGAIVRVKTADREMVRQIKGGTSFASTIEPAILFGLGDAQLVESVEIQWPSGLKQTIEPLAPNRFWIIREGRDAVAEASR